MAVRTLDDLGDVAGQRGLVRVDFNVPLADGAVTDDARIRAALPTIEELRGKGARLLLVSHLGRPKDREPEFSLAPVAEYLAGLLGTEVALAPDLADVPDGDVVMLENIRFEPGETKNDPQLAARLGALADFYVNDAFGAAHRAHASTVGVVEHVGNSAAGRLLQREVETLTGILADPGRPLVAIVGGAKVTDKIGVIDAFLKVADTILIGGAMSYPFFRSQGHAVGASLCEAAGVEPAGARARAGRRQAAPAGRPCARREVLGRQRADPVRRDRRARGPHGPRHRAEDGRAVRGGDRLGRHGVLERSDGRLRAGPVRRRHARGRRGGRRDGRGHGRRWRRQRRGAGAVRPRRPDHPHVDRRRRLAAAARGQDAAGPRGPRAREPHAVHRRQLEDAQDGLRGRGLHPGAAAARSTPPTASTSRSACRSPPCRR